MTRKAQLFVVGTGALALGLAGGIWGVPALKTKDIFSVREIHEQNQRGFTSPLVDFETAREIPEGAAALLKKKLVGLIDDKTRKGTISEVAVYFRDLNNGPWIGINALQNFTIASLVKVPVLIAHLKIEEVNPAHLSERVMFEPPLLPVTQNIAPQQQFVVGNTYTVEELLRQMIIYSDNDAKNVLLTHAPFGVINQVYADLGLPLPDPTATEDSISVKRYASFFRVLYNASYLRRDLSEWALKLLTETTYKEGLRGGVPKSIPVAHKFGERYDPATGMRQLHDCGIVYHPTSPYLLCVMTRGKEFSSLSAFIREVSRIAYETVSNGTSLIPSTYAAP
jgi:beta-lactamase class A